VRLGEDAHAALAAADWPGNVRELENVVSRGVLRAAREGGDPVLVGLRHLDLLPASVPLDDDAGPEAAAGAVRGALPLRDQVAAFKRARISKALERHDGSWAAAARELGLQRGNLHNLATRLGLR
jgi:anaerobic nitric oxide reductase transcription regulator